VRAAFPLVLVLAASVDIGAQVMSVSPFQTPQATEQEPPPQSWLDGVRSGLVRLPIAAALGTALALRPKRRGTPTRTPAVVQTQIVLAIVGAVIMLVVGSSLARAFGIVGAANLVRYRSKIDDPKDAVVMLCTLAIGLAAGVGLFGLASFSTAFLVGALWIIESFEPQARKHFELSVKSEKKQPDLRKTIEPVLKRFHLKLELRTLSDDELRYDVKAPLDVRTDAISNALAAIGPKGNLTVKWDEITKKKSKDDDE